MTKRSKTKSKNIFTRIFKGIYNGFDKVIITPISTLVYKIQRRVGKLNKLDKILNRPNILLYISLILAVLLFYIVDSQATSFMSKDAEFLTQSLLRGLQYFGLYVFG